jgi:hypothetical protein
VTGLRLTPAERQAIVDGTDPVSERHRFRAPLTRDVDFEPAADLPDEREFSLEDWQDDLVDERVDMDPEDRTVTDEMPPGYDPRVWGPGL